MSVILGLQRIKALLHAIDNPHLALKTVHIAGTNGKGTVSALLSSALTENNINVGRFNSPHLIDRWDAISIDNRPIDEGAFRRIEAEIKDINQERSCGATSFELLTAAAFKIFADRNVAIALIEVGLGGRLDATNVLEKPLVSVITRIGLDHEALLGSDVETIAKEKAGIIKHAVPVVIDGNNESTVIAVIERIAKDRQANIVCAKLLSEENERLSTTNGFGRLSFKECAINAGNIACALETLSILKKSFPQLDRAVVQNAISNTKWAGRLQYIDFKNNGKLLLDGAHNSLGARDLRKYIDRQNITGCIWCLALSDINKLEGVLSALVQPEDSVCFVPFDSVDGMPWVQHVDPVMLLDRFESSNIRHVSSTCFADVLSGIQWAWEEQSRRGGLIVITGSLYLISTVLRIQQHK